MPYRVAGRFTISNIGTGGEWPSSRDGVSGTFVDVSGNAVAADVAIGDYLFVSREDQSVWRWRITDITSTSPLTINIAVDDDTDEYPPGFDVSTPLPGGDALIVGNSGGGPAYVSPANLQGLPEKFLAAVSTANAFLEGGSGSLNGTDQAKLDNLTITDPVDLDSLVTDVSTVSTLLSSYDTGSTSDQANSTWLIIGPADGNIIHNKTGENQGLVSGAYDGQENELIGDKSHRWIFGSYDNKVKESISAYIFGSNHNVIMESTNGHSFIAGGGANTMGVGTGEGGALVSADGCSIGTALSSGNRIGGFHLSIISSSHSTILNSNTSTIVGSQNCTIGMKPDGTKKGLITASTVTNGNPANGQTITVNGEVFGAVGAIVPIIITNSGGTTWSRTPIEFIITAKGSGETTMAVHWPSRNTHTFAPTITANTSYAALPLEGVGIMTTGFNRIETSYDSHIEFGYLNSIVGGYNSRCAAHYVYSDNGAWNCDVHGISCVAAAISQEAWGFGAKPFNAGSRTWSAGPLSTAGDNQITELHLAGSTVSSATPINLSVQAGVLSTSWAQNAFLPPNGTFLVTGKVVARGASGTDNGAWEFTQLLKTSAQTPYGNITNLANSATVIHRTSGASSNGWTIDVDDTGVDIFPLKVQGPASGTVKWNAFIRIQELTG